MPFASDSAHEVEILAACSEQHPQRSPDHRFQVLPSGILAFRLPETNASRKAGKEVWLDVLHRVKVCPCGHSMDEMHHWKCAASPRVKPEWVKCQCDSKGLYTNLKAKPALPADVVVPSYASVLWRDGTPKLLVPINVAAVRVPGMPNGVEVWIDADGKARCRHGFTESALTRRHQMRRQQAASMLQDWWLQLSTSMRANVREALWQATRGGGHVFPSKELKGAAAVWRCCSELRRKVAFDTGQKRKRSQRQPAAKPCNCRPGGLRREIFGTMQRQKRPRLQCLSVNLSGYDSESFSVSRAPPAYVCPSHRV